MRRTAIACVTRVPREYGQYSALAIPPSARANKPGDHDRGAPAHWLSGGPTNLVDVVLTIACTNKSDINAASTSIAGEPRDLGLKPFSCNSEARCRDRWPGDLLPSVLNILTSPFSSICAMTRR